MPSRPKHPTPRQRAKSALKTVPPRNGLVALARGRKAGAHRKTEKAERRAAKVRLAKDELP